MKISSNYIVVKKIPITDKIFVDDVFNDEYQRCEVISVNHKSIYMSTDEVLVGENIYFEKAPLFGDDAFLIDEDEIFGVIKGNVIIPRNDIVYVEADKYKHEVDENGIVKDISYDPLKRGNITQDGIVLSSCLKAKHSMFDKELKVEIGPGDHVYTHHFLTDEAYEREFNGKKYYEILYENIYCKVVDGQIEMLNDWNFVTAISKGLEQTESGIILETTEKPVTRTAIMQHPNQVDAYPGDTVLFKTKREYEIDVEGHTYYRILKDDILYNLSQMKALGNTVVVRPVIKSNEVGNIVVSTHVDEAPDTGVVVSVGNNDEIKEGDTILFRKMASTEVDIDGERLLIVNTKNVYVIL